MVISEIGKYLCEDGEVIFDSCESFKKTDFIDGHKFNEELEQIIGGKVKGYEHKRIVIPFIGTIPSFW